MAKRSVLKRFQLVIDFLMRNLGLIRLRKRVQEDVGAKKQMIKSILNVLGIKIPVEHDKSYWTNNFMTWLKDLTVNDVSNKNTIMFLVEDVVLL
ncbi:MAG: hypothetical protein ACK52I_29755, partial [Pseudomonadota bacterium]